MLRNVVYKRNEKDFATKVVEDDSTGVVTAYVDDKVVVTSATNAITGITEVLVDGIAIISSGIDAPNDADGKPDGSIYFQV